MNQENSTEAGLGKGVTNGMWMYRAAVMHLFLPIAKWGGSVTPQRPTTPWISSYRVRTMTWCPVLPSNHLPPKLAVSHGREIIMMLLRKQKACRLGRWALNLRFIHVSDVSQSQLLCWGPGTEVPSSSGETALHSPVWQVPRGFNKAILSPVGGGGCCQGSPLCGLCQKRGSSFLTGWELPAQLLRSKAVFSPFSSATHSKTHFMEWPRVLIGVAL